MKVVIAVIVTLLASPMLALAGPKYASDETRQVIEAMVQAHGGMERWRAAPSIRFDNIMYNTFASKQQFAWWVAHEVIDQKTRRAYQHWPMDDARIGFDGKQVWSENWQRGNPATFMVHFFYYFLNLPWLTQDDGVVLSEPSPFTWPGYDKELIEVRMSYEEAPTLGKTNKDYYVLYIDPESHRLFGYQYANGYRPLLDVMGLPKEREIFGPLWRLITRYEEVDGLLFPSAWRTMPEADERIVGNHVILNIEIDQAFDSEQVRFPPGGVIDEG
jgi:hypothetical protein